MRKFIPRSIKLFIRNQQRKWNDRKLGYYNRFATTKNKPNEKLIVIHQIQQPIYYNPLSANKVDNIQIAIDKITKVVILPGEIFSFWEVIGKPDAKSGFKTGRNIIGNKLQEDIGGGLCQVSGMIYHLALTTGMKIIERHNHTLDLYEEDKRYSPLGADSGVVYGYKDIRFENTLDSPFVFDFDVNENSFHGRLLSTSQHRIYKIVFEREDYQDYRIIKTYRINDDNSREYINLSKYLLPCDTF